MRPTPYVLGAVIVLGSVTPIAAQDRMSSPTTVVRLLGNDNDDRAALGINTGSTGKRDTLGLLIESVTPGSPADKSGLLEGYRIASVNGENLKLSPGDAGEPDMDGIMTRRLVRELGKVKAGDEVALQVYADGALKTVKVKTVAADDRAVVGLGLDGGGSRRDTLGLLVTSVESDGPADKAGIEEGNRIASIDGVDLRVPAAEAVGGELLGAKERKFTRGVQQKKAGDEVTLQVYANGAMKTVKVTTARSADVYKNDGGRFRFNMNGNTSFIGPIAPLVRMQGLQESMRPMQIQLQTMQRATQDAEASAEREATLAVTRSRLAELRARAAGADADWSNADWNGSSGSARLRGSPGSTLALGGLRMSVVSEELSSYFGKGSENGLLVLDTNDEWRPLQAGDVILSVNGKAVRQGDHTSVSLDSDEDTTFVVLRKGARQTLHVKAH
jgi:S1-C subfamily serine protease